VIITFAVSEHCDEARYGKGIFLSPYTFPIVLYFKTDKSKLMRKLQSKANYNPARIDAILVDAIILLYTRINIPATFEECCHSDPTYILWDMRTSSLTPSLTPKTRIRWCSELFNKPRAEKTKRSEEGIKLFILQDRYIPIPVWWKAKGNYSGILAWPEVYMWPEEEFYSFVVAEDEVIRTEQDSYACRPKEADTRLIFNMDVLW